MRTRRGPRGEIDIRSAARRVLGDPQAGGPPGRRCRAGRFRLHARGGPHQLPEVLPGRRRRHVREGRTSTSAIRSTSIPELNCPTTAAPTGRTFATPTSRRRRWRPGSCPGPRSTGVLCVDGWATEVAERYGAEAMAEIEWTAWNDQIAPEIRAYEGRVPSSGHGVPRPQSQIPQESRVGTRVVYTGLFSPRPGRDRVVQAAVGHMVLGVARVSAPVHRGVGDPDHRPLRARRMFDTQWTMWGDCVLPGVKQLKARVPGDRRQHGRGLDEGSPGRCNGTCPARPSTCPSRCPSLMSGS